MAQLTLTAVHPDRRKKHVKVPLDLITALPDRGRFDALVVRICDLPYGASISCGHNNGDRSWTVADDQLNGLSYIPNRPNFEAHTLTCRVIGIVDGEEAVVLEEFDLAISPDGRTPEIPNSEARARRNGLVNFGRAKAWAKGAAWANQSTAATGQELEVLQAIFEDRLAELTQRLKEAETQIAALKRVAREAHAQLSDVEQAQAAAGRQTHARDDVTDLGPPARVTKISSVA